MSEFSFSRETTIHAPAGDVYARLIDFHRWPEWSPWEGLDPDLERVYSGADRGQGAAYAWEGNRKAGKGTMEITGATEASQVQIALTFLKPFKAQNQITFDLAPAGPGTQVTWTMTGSNDGLASKVFAKLMPVEKLVGRDFERGLAQLKAATEGVTPAAS